MLDHFNNFLNRCARYSPVIFYLISISVRFSPASYSVCCGCFVLGVFFIHWIAFKMLSKLLRPLRSRQNLTCYYRVGVICQTFYCRHPVSGA